MRVVLPRLLREQILYVVMNSPMSDYSDSDGSVCDFSSQITNPHHLGEIQVYTERTSRIRSAAKLHRAPQRKKLREFLIEGENSLISALLYGQISEIFIEEEHVEEWLSVIAHTLGKERGDAKTSPPISIINAKAAQALSETVTHTGIFALCSMPDHNLEEVLSAEDKNSETEYSVLAIAVETREPGNAGTIIRTADACGAQAVLFAGEAVDPYGGKATRASAGSIFHLPVLRCPQVSELFSSLKERGYTIIATAGDGDYNLDHADSFLRDKKKIAWLFGNEAHGLGSWQDYADYRVSIPLRGKAESLNLATAAAVCLYETARIHSSCSIYTNNS